MKIKNENVSRILYMELQKVAKDNAVHHQKAQQTFACISDVKHIHVNIIDTEVGNLDLKRT